MAGRKSDFTLPTNTLDDLFSTQEERDDAKLSKIRDIPLELIDDFPDHPFKVRDDEDMIQLVESVKERGVITLATVRQKEDGRYELISGHRRKRACELAGFEAEQREYLAELLKDENNYIWAAVLYGIRYSDDQIVTVALSQVGNVGGEPYWSWYGFGSRVEWCACFVSWCADQCGYIDAGLFPKFAACTSQGVPWFQERGQWQDNTYTPNPGDLIFFNWDQDEWIDHVGIVEKVENGRVYTIEGNSGNACEQNSYPLEGSRIYGYGIIFK